MAGTKSTLFPKTRFSFGTLGSGAYQEIVVVRNFDISTAREATIVGRLHDLSLGGAGGSGAVKLEIIARGEAQSPDDPGLDFFLGAVGDDGLGKALFDNLAASSSPMLKYGLLAGAANVYTNLGPTIRIVVRATQSTSPWSTFDASLSADISLKS